MSYSIMPPSIEEASRKMQDQAFPDKNPFRNKLRRWMKYCLWTSIYASVVAASHLGSAFSEVEQDAGRILASFMILLVLLLLGTGLGTIVWAAVVGLLKIPPKHISTRYVLGLFITVALLASVGNLQTLIVVLLYQLVFFIYKKYSSFVTRKNQI